MNTYAQDIAPPISINGQMRVDGQEWLEYPPSSGRHYVRDVYSRQVDSKDLIDMSINVTVLGIAQDGGRPQLGCKSHAVRK